MSSANRNAGKRCDDLGLWQRIRTKNGPDSNRLWAARNANARPDYRIYRRLI